MDLKKWYLLFTIFVRGCIKKLNKAKYEYKLKKMFGLPDTSKFTFFRNMSEFNYFELERINPNHKIILWGQLKKKHRYCKQAYKIVAGKIRIPLFLLGDIAFLNILFRLSDYKLAILYSIISTIFVYYAMVYPNIKEKKHVDRNTRRSWNWKNYIIDPLSIE